MIQNKSILSKIQKIEREALYEFKEICDQNNINFYMRGGSVMGSVKYGGFVPWDDDIDIAVPREDYEYMLNLFQNRIIADKYKLISYRFCDEMHSYIPRIFLLEEVRRKEGLPANTKLGLCLIDIFPLDGAPKNTFSRQLYIIKVYFFRLLACLDTIYDSEQKDMHTTIQKRILTILRTMKINKLYKQKDIYLYLEKLYQKHNLESSVYIGTISASLMRKEILKKEIWGRGVYKKFEGIDVKIPEKYDLYLKKLYGSNYRREEPSNKKSHINKN